MKEYYGIDLDELFDNESDYSKEYRFDEVTDSDIERAEQTMGYKLSPSYKKLLKLQNGGIIDDEKCDESWLSAIYGIGPSADSCNGLEEMFDNWKNEWEYPDIGIPFGETESAGHDMYYMDFRSVNADGEPRIVRIDNEMDNAVFFVADSLPKFLKLVLENKDIQETAIE